MLTIAQPGFGGSEKQAITYIVGDGVEVVDAGVFLKVYLAAHGYRLMIMLGGTSDQLHIADRDAGIRCFLIEGEGLARDQQGK